MPILPITIKPMKSDKRKLLVLQTINLSVLCTYANNNSVHICHLDRI